MSFLRKSTLLLLLTGAVFFWVLGFRALQALPAEQLTTYHAIDPLDEKNVEAFHTTEEKSLVPVAYTLWEQSNSKSIQALETGRTALVSPLWIEGDSRLLFPQSARLASGDSRGCLVDQATAKALFGHSQATGASITLGETTYEIRGVLLYPQSILVLAGGASTKYSQVTVSSPPGDGDSFALRHGLVWQLKTDSTLYYQLATSFVALPVLFLLGLGVRLFFVLRTDFAKQIIPHSLLSIGIWVLVTAFIYLLLHTIPSSLLPSRWSNFEAWQQIATTTKDYVLSYLRQPRNLPELGHYHAIADAAKALLSIPFLSLAWALYHRKTSPSE